MRLGLIVKRWRRTEDLPLRALAKKLKVSAATLSRFENGKTVDSGTFCKIFKWLMED